MTKGKNTYNKMTAKDLKRPRKNNRQQDGKNIRKGRRRKEKKKLLEDLTAKEKKRIINRQKRPQEGKKKGKTKKKRLEDMLRNHGS